MRFILCCIYKINDELDEIIFTFESLNICVVKITAE